MALTTLLLFAALSALIVAALALTSQIYLNRKRQKRFQTLELIPNILMTRYPLMFVGRSRSLFRLAGDFLEMPVYLQEHGYLVEEIEVQPGANGQKALSRLLETSENPVHMIVSEAFSEAAYDLALEGHPKLATLTMIGHKPEADRRLALRPTPLPVFERPELRPSVLANSFMTEEIALEHMVSLAEYDLR